MCKNINKDFILLFSNREKVAEYYYCYYYCK